MSIERKTPSSVDRSRSQVGRRGLLRGFAAVPAAAALAAAPWPAPAVEAPEPIFAAIEAHKAAAVSHEMILGQQTELEKTLAHQMRQTVYACEIIETDDPRWIEFTLTLDEASDSLYSAARDLLQIDINTIAGVIALLEHTSCAGADDDWQFPEYADEDSDFGSERFSTAAARVALASLRKIEGGSIDSITASLRNVGVLS